MIKIGLIGYGKAGQAVARVLSEDARYDLRWIARRQMQTEVAEELPGQPPLIPLDTALGDDWLDAHPVDGIIDFSSRDSIHLYAPVARSRHIAIVSAISAYEQEDLDLARELAQHTRVLCSPNMTIGINFMMVASSLLRRVAPFADVEILEQHFRDKPEVSGTARTLAASLELSEDKITSLRLGGIVGHHEVIFGFPHQTVRLIHNTIRREAFGTGAAYAMHALVQRPNGFYTFEDLLTYQLRQDLLAEAGGLSAESE